MVCPFYFFFRYFIMHSSIHINFWIALSRYFIPDFRIANFIRKRFGNRVVDNLVRERNEGRYTKGL